MSSTTSVQVRSSQNDPISKPKGVYSIDQILGTQNRQNNNMGKWKWQFIIIKILEIIAKLFAECN